MAAQELAVQVGVAPACQALGVCSGPPSTAVRGRFPGTSSPVQRPPGHCVNPNASGSSMYSPARAVDRFPTEVVATLLDEGEYRSPDGAIAKSGNSLA